MDKGVDSVLPPWAQAAITFGVVATGFIVAAWGKLRDPSPAISQTRAEATEVFVAETRANREALQSLKEILTKDVEMMSKLVAVQNDIAAMMRETRDEQKFDERSFRLLEKLSEKEEQQRQRQRLRDDRDDRERDRDR